MLLSLLAGAGCAPAESSPDPADQAPSSSFEEAPPASVPDPATRSLLTGGPGAQIGNRTNATVTRLQDGRVLVAGGYIYGYGYDNVTPTAEIFDPATNTWSLAAPMYRARFSHNAVLLPDGRVYVVGGWGPGGNTQADPPEVYDPATNTWTQAPPILPYGTSGYTKAAGLPDGRVVVDGLIFDPSSGSFANVPGGSSLNPYQSRIVALADGRLMYVGGANYADIFDGATGTWTTTGPMDVAPSGNFVTALLPDGKVYVAVGGGGKTAELYDPATNTWRLTNDVPDTGVWYGPSVPATLPNGQIVIPTHGSVHVHTELPPAISLTSTEASLGYWMTIGTTLLDGRVLITGMGGTQIYSYPRIPLAAAPLVDSGAGSQNNDVAAADLDWDGAADLVILAGTGVHSLSSRGDGTFAWVNRYSAGTTPVAIELGHFDAYDLDLAIANRDSDNVTVRLGRGDGTFRMAVHWPAGDAPEDLVIADLNGDGRNDIAVAGGGANPTVNVLLGNGGNSFQAPIAYPISVPTPGRIVAGDFNGDGRTDLAVASKTSSSGTIGVLLGQPDGTLLAGTSISAGIVVAGLAAGDLNGDGKLDLALAGDARVLLAGKGDGTFLPGVTLRATPAGDTGIALTDIDGDQDLDIVSTNGVTSDAEILKNNGNGAFQAGTPQSIGGFGPTAVAAGDVDHDGRADLVMTSARFGYHVLRNGGSGLFSPRQDASFGVGVMSPAVADFNGDGYRDVAVANEGSRNATILWSGPSGLTGQSANVATGGDLITKLSAADLNGDGKPDLVATARTSRTVQVALNRGDGSFDPAVAYASAAAWEPMDVRAADIDGDQDLDLVVAGYSGKGVFVLRNNGSGSFQAPVRYSTGTAYPRALELADVNHDGKLDALTANYSGNSISVLLGNATGGFGAATSYTSPGFLRGYAIAVSDLNRDGNVDVVVGTYDSFDVRVFLGNAQGTFQATATTYSVGESARAVIAEDLTGDGIPDIGAVTSTNSALHLWKGVGDGTFLGRETTAIGRSARGLLATDLNGDGKRDLVVAVQGSNAAGVLYNVAY
jgi:hypothetical protein